MTQPRIGEPTTCPTCGSGAVQWLSDKHGRFIICLTCGHNSERIRGLKRRTGRRNKGVTFRAMCGMIKVLTHVDLWNVRTSSKYPFGAPVRAMWRRVLAPPSIPAGAPVLLVPLPTPAGGNHAH